MKKRRLVAIMFTDIKGYTAIMQGNEDEALALRNKHREVFQKSTEKFNGEILQYYGDGTLSIFDSAVDAVKCGIEIQKEMQAGKPVPLRVGIHSGDIIFMDDDIIGDGVNVASRIESLAIVGSVLISDKVYDEVKNNSSIETKFLKTFTFKNVNQPIGVHAIANPGLAVPDAKSLTGKIEKSRPAFFSRGNRLLIPSIFAIMLIAVISFWIGSLWENDTGSPLTKKVAVMPFTQESDLEDVSYFGTGMTNELINELSKNKELKVISQASTQVVAAGVGSGNDLINYVMDGINYFVDGSIKRDFNQVSASIELKLHPDSASIWTNNYNTDITGVRQIWIDVAEDLSGQMGVTPIVQGAVNRLGLRPIKPETYELYLKGMHHMNGSTDEDFYRGIVYLQEAIDKNPGDPYAHAGLAEAYVRLGHGPAPPPDVFPKALAAAKRAIELDSMIAEGWAALSHYHTYFGMDWALAEYAFERANTLNPNLAYNHYHRAWYLALFGKMNEAIEEHTLAQELDPFTPLHTAWLGELYRWVGEYEKGLAEVEKVTNMGKEYALGLTIKGRILVDQGKTEEGIKILREAAGINPGWKYIGLGPALIETGNLAEAKMIIQELESMPTTSSGALFLGILYTSIGDLDKGFEWFNYKYRHGWFPWIRVMFAPDRIKKDPRFLKLMEDMNLPPPAPLVYNPEV